MLDAIAALAQDLREVGVPVSSADVLDGAGALTHIAILDRDTVRDALRCCLVKQAEDLTTFDLAFERRFETLRTEPIPTGDAVTALQNAIETGDLEALTAAVQLAVLELAGLVPGRFLGTDYHVRRVMRRLDAAGALALGADLSGGDLDLALDMFRVQQSRSDLEERIAAEVRRRMGPDDARRGSPAGKLDFLRATPDEVHQLRQHVTVLGRRLASRLRRRRAQGKHGRLNARATIRHALGTGGILFDPKFQRPHPHRPDVVVLADVSGSVATFARFTLQLVHALGGQFNQLRTFVFVDEIDEVSSYFGRGDDVVTVMRHVDERARTLGAAGHSDYGRVLEAFVGRWGRTLRPTTTVLVLGDARNNYHPVNDASMADLRRRVRRVFWLNPEPRSHWDTADSVMSRYGLYCDDVLECRNLEQLAAAVDSVS